MLYWNTDTGWIVFNWFSVEPKQMLYWNSKKRELMLIGLKCRTETNVVLKYIQALFKENMELSRTETNVVLKSSFDFLLLSDISVEPKQMLYWNSNHLFLGHIVAIVEPKQMLYWNFSTVNLIFNPFQSNRNKCCIEISYNMSSSLALL